MCRLLHCDARTNINDILLNFHGKRCVYTLGHVADPAPLTVTAIASSTAQSGSVSLMLKTIYLAKLECARLDQALTTM